MKAMTKLILAFFAVAMLTFNASAQSPWYDQERKPPEKVKEQPKSDEKNKNDRRDNDRKDDKKDEKRKP